MKRNHHECKVIPMISRQKTTTNRKVQEVINNLSIAEVIAILHQLPEPLNTIFHFYELEEYSHSEIGDMLHITKSKSERMLDEATSMIQDILVREKKIPHKASILYFTAWKTLLDGLEVVPGYDMEAGRTSVLQELEEYTAHKRSRKDRNIKWYKVAAAACLLVIAFVTFKRSGIMALPYAHHVTSPNSPNRLNIPCSVTVSHSLKLAAATVTPQQQEAKGTIRTGNHWGGVGKHAVTAISGDHPISNQATATTGDPYFLNPADSLISAYTLSRVKERGVTSSGFVDSAGLLESTSTDLLHPRERYDFATYRVQLYFYDLWWSNKK